MKLKATFEFAVICLALIITLACFTQQAFSQLTLDGEVNVIAGVPYNKVRIPSTGGTQFDLAKDLNIRNRVTYRLRVNYTIKQRHVLSALYAPLTIRSRGQFDNNVIYSGETFSAGETVDAKYKFNSYRLTYRYLIVSSEKVKFGLGLTGKIRDANITLSQEGRSADFPDLGFVPLVNFYLDVNILNKLNVLLEGDALASKQGRAEDVFLGLLYPITKSVAVKAGFRMLEGGADVERNYNFAWVNYASAGLLVHFGSED